MRFSILTTILVTTIFALSTYIWVQNIESEVLRSENREYENEIGIIEGKNKDSVYVRPLMAKGAFNSWRFRVKKPTQGYEYCIGIVNCDQLGNPILPYRHQQYFQVVDSKVTGEIEVAVSVWRDAKSRWYFSFQEFEGRAKKLPSATRIDAIPDQIMSQVLSLQSGMIQNNESSLPMGIQENGNEVEYAPDETVVLILSATPQPMDYRRAFVVAIRPSAEQKD